MKIKMVLFSWYSYFMNLFNTGMEILPPFIREIIFRLMFKKYGKNNNIDFKTYFRYPTKISIGSNVWINRECQFYASHFIKDAEIVIGNNIAFGPGVTIFSAGHDYTRIDLPDTAQSVIIKDNVWIGGRTIILPGVIIGEGCIIGAGSVVTKSLLPYSVAVGNPAKVIKRREIKDVTI